MVLEKKINDQSTANTQVLKMFRDKRYTESAYLCAVFDI